MTTIFNTSNSRSVKVKFKKVNRCLKFFQVNRFILLFIVGIFSFLSIHIWNEELQFVHKIYELLNRMVNVGSHINMLPSSGNAIVENRSGDRNSYAPSFTNATTTTSDFNNDCRDCGNGELSFLTVSRVQLALSKHPLKNASFHESVKGLTAEASLVEYIKYLYRQPACRRKSNGMQMPVFISMANVYSDLYWQL